VLDGSAAVSVNDIHVSQPRNLQPLIDFHEQHVPAAERDSFLLSDAVDRLPFTFNQEDPGACAVISDPSFVCRC
jgi:hypothetical protein